MFQVCKKNLFWGIWLASALVLLCALAFQYIGGLHPCHLCLYERTPYILVLLLAAVYMQFGSVKSIWGLLIVIFILSAALAFYHAGIEQKWWEGYSACASVAPKFNTVEEMKAYIMATPVVRCDEIRWQFLGLTMAAYNAIVSLVLSGFSVVGFLNVKQSQKKMAGRKA